MIDQKLRLVVSFLAIAGLSLASCAPTAAPPPAAPAATVSKAPTSPAPAAQATAAAPAPTAKSAADQPRYGGILNISVYDDPPSLDAHQETSAVTLWAIGGVYNGLTQYDPLQNDKVIPDLAEKWDVNPQGTSYTFHLRKGVKWHDGKPFTAQDAKFSMDRILKPPQGTRSPRAAVFESMSGVEAPDDSTLRMVLKNPAASFMANMSTGWMLMMPRHVIEAKGNMKQTALGTGPYKLKDYSPGTSYDLVKNPDYFVKGRPYLDGIKNYAVKDPATRLASFRTGQLMMTVAGSNGIKVSQAQLLEKEMGDKVVVHRVGALNFHSFMMNSKVKPWDDVRVRKAANMAIDRVAGVNTLDEGDGDLGGTMPPSGQWGFPKDELLTRPGYRPDKAAEIAEARKLLAEAGYPNGLNTPLLVRSSSENQNLGVFVQAQLENVGIKATITVAEVAAFTNNMERRNFSSATWAHAASLDDPDQIFGEHYVSKGGRNYQGVANPKVDELFAQQSRTMDVAERKKLVIEMQRVSMDDYGKLAIYWKRERQAVWAKVKNYKVGYGVYNNNKYQDVWLAN
ncbi:MAG: ABC transporter substrate-binding protein [Chloroflexi bacterium]|nr:ABC transporter substrate-binding protein [Chloroflexota bacterium]